MIAPGEQFLSDRLKAVHDMAVSGVFGFENRRIIDVGSDHGQLSLYSLINDGFGKALLTDIHEEPARRSGETMRMYGFEGKSEVFCTDGLDGIELMEGDIIIMAGLGGNNMIDIISRALLTVSPAVLKSITWVLQPQKSGDSLREYLFESGFTVVDENAVVDRGLYYLIIKSCFTGERHAYSLSDKHYGPVILRRAQEGEEPALSYVKRLNERFRVAARGNPEIKRMLEDM